VIAGWTKRVIAWTFCNHGEHAWKTNPDGTMSCSDCGEPKTEWKPLSPDAASTSAPTGWVVQ